MLRFHARRALTTHTSDIARLLRVQRGSPRQEVTMSAGEPLSKKDRQATMASQRAKETQEKIRQDPRTERGAPAFFPVGYKEAAYQWWTSVSAAAAERNVLNFMPYVKEVLSSPSDAAVSAEAASSTAQKDPYGPRTWTSSMVQLSGKNRAIHEIAIQRTKSDQSPSPSSSSSSSSSSEAPADALVMLHGYGAGLGFFYKNFEPLSRPAGWKLYALDMLGMGNSSRPPFKIHAKDQEGKITEAENWFIDALEEWRIARKVEQFTLLGHSLGGYLAVSYALKYPGRLKKLILASPVGIPEDPYAVSAPVPQNEPEESAMANELMRQESTSMVEEPAPLSSSSAAKSAANNNNNNNSSKTDGRPKRPWWFTWLWDTNMVSPFSIVRAAGPFGPRFVSGWTSRRFNHLSADEAAALHTYSYSLFRQRGSGEFALTYILAPGAYARRPVINRIQGVGRQVLQPATASSPAVRETGIPVVIMYGDRDWMDVAGGYAAEEKLRQTAARALTSGTDEENARENGSAKVLIVSKAGHHLYIDNADEFNEYVTQEMEETRKETLRTRARETVRDRRTG